MPSILGTFVSGYASNISTMFISSGFSGVFACLTDNETEWVNEMVKGACMGIISTFFSEIAGKIVKSIIGDIPKFKKFMDCSEKIIRNYVSSSSAIAFDHAFDHFNGKQLSTSLSEKLRHIIWYSALSYGINVGFEQKYKKAVVKSINS